MRSGFFALMGAAVAFAAGWFLRPLSLSGTTEDGSRKGALSSAGGGRGFDDAGRAAHASSKPAGEPATQTQSLEQVANTIRTLLREKDALKRSAAIRSLVANAAPDEVATLVKAYNICMNEGWPTREMGELVTVREGQVLGKAGEMVWTSARHSPGATLDLLNEYLPQNEFLAAARGKFISECVKIASNNTVNSIGEWLNAHRASPIYNDVATQFLTHVQSIDPQGAKAWAESITDEAVRAEMLSRLQQGRK